MTGTEPAGGQKPEFKRSTPNLEVDPVEGGSDQVTAQPEATAPAVETTQPRAAAPIEPATAPAAETPAMSDKRAEMAAPHVPQSEEVKATQEKPKNMIGKALDWFANKFGVDENEAARIQERQAKAGINTTGEHPAITIDPASAESLRRKDLNTLADNGAIRVQASQREQIGTGTIEPKDKNEAA